MYSESSAFGSEFKYYNDERISGHESQGNAGVYGVQAEKLQYC